MARKIQMLFPRGNSLLYNTFETSLKNYSYALTDIIKCTINLTYIDNYASDKTLNIINSFDKSDIIVLLIAFICIKNDRVQTLTNYLNIGNPIILINSESIDRVRQYPWCVQPHIYKHKNLLMVWDYEHDNIIRLKQKLKYSIPHYYFPPMYSPTLELTKKPSNILKDIDVLFYGCTCSRRLEVLDNMINMGINVYIPQSGSVRGFFSDFQEQDKIMARSKIIIVIHSYEFDRIIDYYRISPLISNKHFIVHESANENDINEDFNRHFTMSPYNDLADTCARVLKMTQEERDKSVQKGYEYFKHNYNTTDFVPQALIDFCSKE